LFNKSRFIPGDVISLRLSSEYWELFDTENDDEEETRLYTSDPSLEFVVQITGVILTDDIEKYMFHNFTSPALITLMPFNFNSDNLLVELTPKYLVYMYDKFKLKLEAPLQEMELLRGNLIKQVKVTYLSR